MGEIGAAVCRGVSSCMPFCVTLSAGVLVGFAFSEWPTHSEVCAEVG